MTRTLAVVLVAAAVLMGCQTPCAGDTDCPSGQRCNTALKSPACQQLYTGGVSSTCSSGLFCESRACVKAACTTPGQPPPLGSATPLTITWPKNAQGQFTAAIDFSDDARNDCAASQANMLRYGKGATLAFVPNSVSNGQVLTWATDQSARMGTAVKPFAWFLSDDTLSGIPLSNLSGTVTVEHVPTASDPSFVVTLASSDGAINATYTATPVCP